MERTEQEKRLSFRQMILDVENEVVDYTEAVEAILLIDFKDTPLFKSVFFEYVHGLASVENLDYTFYASSVHEFLFPLAEYGVMDKLTYLSSPSTKVHHFASMTSLHAQTRFSEFKLVAEYAIRRSLLSDLLVSNLYHSKLLNRLVLEYRKNSASKLKKLVELILNNSLNPNQEPGRGMFIDFAIEELSFILTEEELKELLPLLTTFFLQELKASAITEPTVSNSDTVSNIEMNYQPIWKHLCLAFSNELKRLLAEHPLNIDQTISFLSNFKCHDKIIKPHKSSVINAIKEVIQQFPNSHQNSIITFVIFEFFPLLSAEDAITACQYLQNITYFSNSNISRLQQKIQFKDFIPQSKFKEWYSKAPDSLENRLELAALLLGTTTSASKFNPEEVFSAELDKLKNECLPLMNAPSQNVRIGAPEGKLFYNYLEAMFDRAQIDFNAILHWVKGLTSRESSISSIKRLFNKYGDQLERVYKSNGHEVFSHFLRLCLIERLSLRKLSNYFECLRSHLDLLKKTKKLNASNVNLLLAELRIESFIDHCDENTIYLNLLLIQGLIKIQQEYSIWLDYYKFAPFKAILSKYKISSIPYSQIKRFEKDLLKAYIEMISLYLSETGQELPFEKVLGHQRGDSMTKQVEGLLYLASINQSHKEKILNFIFNQTKYGDMSRSYIKWVIQIMGNDPFFEKNIPNTLQILDSSKEFLNLFKSNQDYDWLNCKIFQRVFFTAPNNLKSMIYKHFQRKSLRDSTEVDSKKSLESFLNPIPISSKFPHYLLKLVTESLYRDPSIPPSQKVSFAFLNWSFFHLCSELINIKRYPIYIRSSLISGFESKYCLLKSPPSYLYAQYMCHIPINHYHQALENATTLYIDNIHQHTSLVPFATCKQLKTIIIKSNDTANPPISQIVSLAEMNSKTLEYLKVIHDEFHHGIHVFDSLKERIDNPNLQIKYFPKKYIQTIYPSPPRQLEGIVVIMTPNKLDLDTLEMLLLRPVKTLHLHIKDQTTPDPIKLSDFILRILKLISTNLTVEEFKIKLIPPFQSQTEFSKMKLKQYLNQLFQLLNENHSVKSFKFQIKHDLAPISFNHVSREIINDFSKVNFGDFYLPNPNHLHYFKRDLSK